MDVHYKQKQDDYFNAIRHISRKLYTSTRWKYLPTISGGVFGMLFVIGALSISKFYEDYFFIDTGKLTTGLVSISAGVVLLVLGLYIYRKKVKYLAFDPDGLYLSEQAYIIQDDYLVHYMGDSKYYHAWKHVREIEKTGDYLFIFIDRGASLYIPYHAFDSVEDYNDFYSALCEHKLGSH